MTDTSTSLRPISPRSDRAQADGAVQQDRRALPVIVAIGGSDSSGGAGIQADLKTVAASGGYARTVVTAITAQHSGGVVALWPVPVASIEAQLRAAYLDTPPVAVKTGMLANRETVELVARVLRELGAPRLVVDPVVRSSSGAALLDDAGVEALRALLLPLAMLVTPNAAEAALLSGIEVHTPADAIEAARRILALGAGAVLVTGGHLASEPGTDVLVTPEGTRVFIGEFLPGREVHGTGCALASAIATRLALGDSIEAAVDAAKAYVSRLIATAMRVGPGALMPDHLAAAASITAAPTGGGR